MPFFPVGVFIIEFLILKKKLKQTKPTLPNVFKTVAQNTRFFLFGLTKVTLLLRVFWFSNNQNTSGFVSFFIILYNEPVCIKVRITLIGVWPTYVCNCSDK